ncbi:MAG TPA: hypothetical protein VFP53_08455 [Sphingomicrobium sp.]|nr:hypothetical protein [Sphingomicrobium sp.]
MDDEGITIEDAPDERKRRNWWLIVALVAAVAAGVLLASTVWDNRWQGESEDSATTTAEADQSDPQSWCAAQTTYDSIRRELFRRAAQVRGADEQDYARLADFALLRVNAPVVRGIDDQLDSVTCSGNVHLDLPPGVSVAGGRRSLAGDVDYMVQPAADGTGNVVRLGNADSIVIPLATLVRTGAPSDAPLVPPGEVLQEAPADALSPVQPTEEEETSDAVTANPSFDCDDARSRGEIAVCRDPGLAALDRQMAAQFNDAVGRADRRQRRLLERTRSRFLSYRDRCDTNQCVAETYRGRIREIGDIMSGRWRG